MPLTLVEKPRHIQASGDTEQVSSDLKAAQIRDPPLTPEEITVFKPSLYATLRAVGCTKPLTLSARTY